MCEIERKEEMKTDKETRRPFTVHSYTWIYIFFVDSRKIAMDAYITVGLQR